MKVSSVCVVWYLVSGFFFFVSHRGYCEGNVSVITPQGELIGASSGYHQEVVVFKGIPYAQPPVGMRRWKPAEPAPTWKGVRLATKFGPDCMGLSSYINPTRNPESQITYHPPSIPSEDCLYLNVWTPMNNKVTGKEKLPVMVWIHSGGAVMGSGSWPLYDGAELAHKGVVVITFNYRLGVFGFLAHPELTAESPENSSGNYGITDQIEALRWVRDNIKAFGGDPSNVTIFGESFGSASVSALMVSPLSEGLFHKAIGQSGSAFNQLPVLDLPTSGMPSAESAGVKFARSFGTLSINELRSRPASELLHAATKRLYSYFPNLLRILNVDGWILPDQPYRIFFQGDQHDIPVIVGFNSDETYDGMPPIVATNDYVANIEDFAGNWADDYLSLYPPTEKGQLAARRYGVMGWWMESWARMMGNVSSDVYLYYFDHPPPGSPAAFHTADISYVFNNEKYSFRFSENLPAGPPRPSDINLANTMSDYWVSFARSGRPQVDGIPLWKPYRNTARNWMKFEEGQANPAKNLFPGAWLLHEKILQARQRRVFLSGTR